MNTEVGGMSDAYSVIVNDCDKFTSLMPSVVWRPTNLTSLASASIGASSVKPASFLCAIVFAMVTTYVFLKVVSYFTPLVYFEIPDIFVYFL